MTWTSSTPLVHFPTRGHDVSPEEALSLIALSAVRNRPSRRRECQDRPSSPMRVLSEARLGMGIPIAWLMQSEGREVLST
jgi:hypothetical protein